MCVSAFGRSGEWGGTVNVVAPQFWIGVKLRTGSFACMYKWQNATYTRKHEHNYTIISDRLWSVGCACVSECRLMVDKEHDAHIQQRCVSTFGDHIVRHQFVSVICVCRGFTRSLCACTYIQMYVNVYMHDFRSFGCHGTNISMSHTNTEEFRVTIEYIHINEIDRRNRMIGH